MFSYTKKTYTHLKFKRKMALLILDTTVREEDIQSLQLWCAGQAVSTWVAVIGISLISCVFGTENLISIEKNITNYNLVSKPTQTSKFETQYTWNAIHLHETIEKSICNQFVFLYIRENTFWTDAKNSGSLAWLIECCGLSHRWSWEFIRAYFHYASNTICYWNLGGMGQ